jgi:hypothetical protein
MSDYFGQLVQEFEEMAKDCAPDSIVKLKLRLEVRDNGTYDKHVIPYLACRALIYKGVRGIEAMAEVLPRVPGFIYPMAILSSLWQASEGEHSRSTFETSEQSAILQQPINETVRFAAKEAFIAFLDECRTDPESFHRLINLLHHEQTVSSFEKDSNGRFHQAVYRIIADSALRVSDRHIDQLDQLLRSGAREEAYQIFLTANPVFLNPLASRLIGKQKLGDDFITDYVLETLTGEYVAVEIEKPTDPVFTQTNDFSHQFTHAFGQVIDFIEWVEQNISYAQKKLPGIASPRGLLVIGTREFFSKEQSDKLRRFNKNSNSIEVITFDDLLSRARTLQQNIRHRVGFV